MKALVLTALLAASAAQAANTTDHDTLRPARNAYLDCAMLALPRQPSRIVDPRRAATNAVDRCRTEKLALAGQFAMANPGSRNVHDISEKARRQAIDDLSAWIVDMEAMFIERQR